MAEHPYLPLWTDAYLGDTTHLTTIEHGAYLLLLMVMWRSKTCSIPNDDKILARYTKTTTAQWRRLKPVLMDFFDEQDGYLVQGRLSDERNVVRQKSKSASDSAKARWLKSKDSADANACKTHSERNATTPTPTTNKDIYTPDFEKIWRIYPRKIDKRRAFKAYKKAVKSGVTPEDIIEGVHRYSAHCKREGTEMQFIQHPTTWLNGGGWESEYSSQKQNFGMVEL